MKKAILKILILFIVMLMLASIHANAQTFNLSATSEVKAGEEIIVNINSDKKIEAATFYIKYDSSKIDYVENISSGPITKDYPEDGTLRVAYVDMSMEGTENFSFKFKAKQSSNSSATLEITNLSIVYVGDETEYTQENLKNSILKFDVNIQGGISTTLIITIIIAVVIVIALIVLFCIRKNKKSK